MSGDSNAAADAVMRQFRRLVLTFVVIVAVPAVLLAVYLDRRFDSVDRDLHYEAPQPNEAALPVELAEGPSIGQTVYVPAYSHVYEQDGKPLLLTVTLSVRNTDPDSEIHVASVRYYDSAGKEVKSYLDEPMRLGPLASMEVLVERKDTTGGSGANFLVEWQAIERVSDPVIDAVMIDTSQTQGVSFIRTGIVIAEQGDGEDEG